MTWKELLSDEIHYKEKNNINGLLDVSYQFFNSHASINNALFWFFKIGYYCGRILDESSTEKYIQFTKEKKNILSLILNDKKVNIGQNLLQIGSHYPNLNSHHIEFINNLYQDDNYRDFLDDIFFDATRYNLSFIKKSDNSPTKVRNSEFSSTLIEMIFDGFLKNKEFEISNLKNVYYFYNRAKNSVELVRDNEVIRFIHFFIDFNKNRSYATRILNKNSPISISTLVTQNFVTKSNDEYEIEFNHIGWNELNKLLLNNLKKPIVDDVLSKFKNEITLDWLNDLNGIN
jgi:hypothetical protein